MGSFVNHLVFSKSWRYRLARHAIFWLSYFAVFGVMDLPDRWDAATVAALSYWPVNMLFVYVVLYLVVPRLLMRSAYLPFFACYCAWGLACLAIEYAWGYLVLQHSRLPSVGPWHTFTNMLNVSNITVANVMAGLGVALVMYKYWRGEVWQKLQVRQARTKAELELLKTQLHPHFLFNTLNNLYALVIEQSDKAPQMLMRLSAILSYVLYECRAPEVPLEREIGICKDYIELERERFGERLDVSLDFSGPLAGKMIAPMLFQPFIENAFRHGASEQNGKVWMSVELSVRHDQLFFRVINSADFATGPDRPNPDGMGLDNIIRRLGLLYPDRHRLTRDKGDGVYIVSFTIDLNSSALADLHPAEQNEEPALYENAVFNY
jgi:hypothetical protein